MNKKEPAPTSKATASKAPRAPASSPVADARHLKAEVRLRLAAATAGRCEFPGCNKHLYAHPLTKDEGNYSQAAHIVAFSTDGPRGADGRPADVNAFENLMLLCVDCHHLIDTSPADYPVSTLRGYKKEHEQRIWELTSVGPELRTAILQLKGVIGGQHVDIPAPAVRMAVAPRYTADQRGHIIDLTSIPIENAEFFRLARDVIRRDLRECLRGGIDGPKVRHFSVFALAPIPVLVTFGRELGDKLATDMYQRHRDGGADAWKWKLDGAPVEYELRRLREGTDPKRVGLVLSLSGVISASSLPAEVDDRFSLYEITLQNRAPNREFLRQRDDLARFRRVYQEALAMISKNHQGLEELLLFPAVPAPIAIACGQELLPKVHPDLAVYDNVKGSFVHAITINRRDDL